MTVNGVVVLTAGAVALFAWWVLGYAGALLIAIGCAALLVSALPWLVRGPAPVEIRFTAVATTIVRGTAFALTATAGAIGGGSRRALRADVCLRETTTGTDRGAPISLAAGRNTDVPEIAVPRGRYHATIAAVTDICPLGLWRRRVTFAVEPLLLKVVPERVTLAAPPDTLDHDEDGRAAPLASGSGANFAALREYVPGDNIRLIDWAATARATDEDTVYVRQFVPSRVSHLTIVLDPDRVVGPRRSRRDHVASFEVAIDLAYSFAVATGVDTTVDLWCDPLADRPLRTVAEIESALLPLGLGKPRRRPDAPHLPELLTRSRRNLATGAGGAAALTVVITTCPEPDRLLAQVPVDAGAADRTVVVQVDARRTTIPLTYVTANRLRVVPVGSLAQAQQAWARQLRR
jgi:hypothetical protein